MPKKNELEKQIITEVIHTDINIEMDLLTLIGDLNDEYNEHKDIYHKIYIETEKENGYYGDCYFNVNIIGERYENDKEYNKRIEELKKQKELNKINAKKSKEMTEIQERKLLEELKKKYENK